MVMTSMDGTALCLVCVILLCSAIMAQTAAQPAPVGLALFVATDGDDGNAGTLDAPLATLHEARNRIRALKAETGLPEGGVTVYLRGGEYVMTDPGEVDQLLGRVPERLWQKTTFKLERADSGTEAAPIVYRAYEDEPVTLARDDSVDYRVSLIINQADHVFFEGIRTRGGRFDWLNREPVHVVAEAEGESLRIVADGQSRATVVIADEPSDVARYAAEELVEHVRKATGITLPLVHEAQAPAGAPNHHRLFIGETAAADGQGLRAAELAPEAFILRTLNGDLYVLGRESDEAPLAHGNPWVGSAHGVYELLERCLEVRWLWPGELGTHVPQTDEVVIAPVNETVEPALRYRAWSGDTSTRPTAVFLRRHGMGSGVRPHVGHFVQHWWDIYGEEHPEWFALNPQGERVGPTLCVSNPELQRHVAQMRSRPEHTPVRHGAWARGTIWDDYWNGGDTLTLGEADSTAFCHCADCEALDEPHPEDLDLSHVWMRRVLADRYVKLWQTAFERARRINPEVRITSFLYWQTFHAPLGDVQLDENSHGEFVQWMGRTQWFPMPEDAYRHIREQWLGWRRTGITMGYRPNYFHGGYVLPFFSTRQAGEFLSFAHEEGSLGWAGDSLFGHWSTQGPMLYMHMRMLKDPELTVDEARAEFFSGFGPAAEPVQRYFDYWEDFAHEVVNTWTWPSWGLQQMVLAPRIFTADVFAPAEAILDEALEAARQNPRPEYARRVEFIRLGLDHAVLAMNFIALLDDGEVVLHDRERFEATQQAWREMQAFRMPRRETTETEGGLRLDYDLHVARYLVTHDQYHAFCEATDRPKRIHHQARDREDYGDFPITGNTWADYAQYCNWLSEQAGLEPAYIRDEESRGGWALRDAPERLEGYRMPLQREWEYAARGGAEADTATIYAGSNVVGEVAWTGNTDGLQPVGQLAPNALGLHDMSGLLNEWVNEGHLLGGSYWYPAQQAVIYPNPRRTNWAGRLDEQDNNQNWQSGLRVVRTAIGEGPEAAEVFPEMVLVQAGTTLGNPLPFLDVNHIRNRLENRWLTNLDALEKGFEEVRRHPPMEAPNPWSEWRFRMDPDNRGMEEGWQAEEFDEDQWRPIEAPAFWARTWVGPYLGYGWYRTTFVVPQDWTGQQVNLDFGGVDEQAWVFVNGELVGEHTVESEGMTIGQLWDRPFTIEVPAERLRPGQENTLVVRVHGSVGNAGIHQPVVGHAPHPELWRPLPER